jgi:hypothetical protein
VIGQYEDEAPVRTWNVFGFQTAASVGRGGTALAYGEDPSAGTSNPALLLDLPRLAATLNGTASSASLFRYALVNTGVLATRDNFTINPLALDFAGVSFQSKGWAFGLSAALLEVYDRPKVSYQSSSQGGETHKLNFHQTGFLRNFNFAIARRIGRHLRAGLGLNLVTGDLERTTEENFSPPNITISDRVTQKFSGFFINGGIAVEVTRRLDVAFAFESPFSKKSEDKSQLRYLAPAGGTDILISSESSDTYKQPWVAGLAARYKIAASFRALADFTYFNWSKYKASYFGEDMVRNFRDTLRIGSGIEYEPAFRLLGSPAGLPFRVGIAYDKQPMQEPVSSYLYFSAGVGFHWKGFLLDLGTSFGKEHGSGRSLKARRISLSLSVGL